MQRTGVYTAVAAAFLMLPGLVFGETTDPRLVVRLYDNYSVPAKHLQEARQLVEAIFDFVGVNISWLDCWRGHRDAADALLCRKAVTVNEVVLRLQRAVTQPEQEAPLGFSFLSLTSGVPFLATVHPDRVASTARTSNASVGTLLGRVIAHEMGHLLLNRNEHTSAGLMKARWSRRDLNEKDWTFQSEEIAAIQAAAERRNMRPASLAATR